MLRGVLRALIVATLAAAAVGQVPPAGFTSVPRVRKFRPGSGRDVTLSSGVKIAFDDNRLERHAVALATDLNNIAGIVTSSPVVGLPVTTPGLLREAVCNVRRQKPFSNHVSAPGLLPHETYE